MNACILSIYSHYIIKFDRIKWPNLLAMKQSHPPDPKLMHKHA